MLRWLPFEHPSLAAQNGFSRSAWARFDIEFVLSLRCGAILVIIRRLNTCLSGAPVLRWLAFKYPSLAAQKGVTRSPWGKLGLEFVLSLVLWFCVSCCSLVILSLIYAFRLDILCKLLILSCFVLVSSGFIDL